jgi:sugar lactone lactonase YvrE
MLGRAPRLVLVAAAILSVTVFAVATADPGTTYLGSFGSPGSGSGQLGGPNGIATDDAGNVYVADTYNLRVQKFSPTGTHLLTFGSPGIADGKFQFPYGIDVDDEGFIYVSDLARGDLQKFAPSGAHVLTFGASAVEPFGLWVDDASDVVYVTDRAANQVRTFSSATGAPLGDLGPVVGPVTLVDPQNVEGDGAGNLYISDGATAFRIVVTSLGGAFGRTFPDPAGGNPTGGAFAGGRFFLSSYNLHRVTGVLPGADVALETLGDDEPVSFNSPLDCASSGDQLYVLDTGNGKVHRFQVNAIGTPPTAQVVAPNGGESFVVGAVTTLEWTASDDGAVTAIDLELSRDGGVTYGTIATGLAHTGSYEWTVTGPASITCRLRVVAHDDQDMAASDASDANWAITGSPDGGPLAVVYEGSFGSPGTGAGQFGGPDGIATSDDGFVYVADTHNARVQKFDLLGTHVLSFGSAGSGPGQFSRPYGIDVDDEGNVYVGDLDLRVVQKFSSSGVHQLTFGDGALAMPFGLWVDDNVVYVTDRPRNRIARFTTQGLALSHLSANYPQNVEGDGENGLYVSQGTHPFRVTLMATTGGVVDHFGESQLGNPTGAALAAGHLVITEYAEQRFRLWDLVNDVEIQTVTDAGPHTPMGAPIDCATSGDSLLFVVDAVQGRVHRYRLVDTNPPAVTVVSPNGGEELEVGDPATLQWTATGASDIAAVSLAISRNGGASYTTIASGLPNTGSYAWTVTGPGSSSCRLRVTATDELGVSASDVSDGTFTIVAPPVGMGNFELAGTFGEGLAGPNGIAMSDDGKLYIADTYASRVQVYDLDGNHLFDFGTAGSGAGQFQTPYGIDVDPAGNVFVSDFTLRRVQKFDASGAYLATIDGPANLQLPLGLWVSEDGILYVTDRPANRVRRYAVDGTPLAAWGPEQDGQTISWPQNIEADRDGRLYVSEGESPFRIMVFDAAGLFQFAMPRPPDVNPTGGAFIGDHFLLTAYNLDRAYEIVVPGGDVAGILEGLSTPLDVATSGDSVAFVLDTGNGRVVKYRWTGSPPPAAAVLAPNGGEMLHVGTEVALTWNATDDHQVTMVDVVLSRDGGVSYHPIAVGVPNSGSLSWTVTAPAAPDCRLRVIAHDEGDRFGIDRSDAAFAIAGASVSTEVPPVELAFTLAPVPVSGVCRIGFALPRAARVRLAIHDVQGREIARVAEGAYEAGRHELAWSATSSRGRVAAGVYFATLKVAGERTLKRRLVVVP